MKLLCDFKKVGTSLRGGRMCVLYRDAGLRLTRMETLPSRDQPHSVSYHVDGCESSHVLPPGADAAFVRLVVEAVLKDVCRNKTAARMIEERSSPKSGGASR